MSVSAETRADRPHAALSATFVGMYAAVAGASFERRAGHVQLLFPSVPLALFNGVLVESEPCSGIADSTREVEDRDLRCDVQLRAGRHPEVEVEAARLGLSKRTSMPGMTVTPDELADVRARGLEIVRVDDEGGLALAAQVAATAAESGTDYPGLFGLPRLTFKGPPVGVKPSTHEGDYGRHDDGGEQDGHEHDVPVPPRLEPLA